jgi:hypothetical protein
LRRGIIMAESPKPGGTEPALERHQDSIEPEQYDHRLIPGGSFEAARIVVGMEGADHSVPPSDESEPRSHE